MFAVAMVVAAHFFVIGIAIAIWSAAQMLVFPIWRSLVFLLRAPILRGHRRRALALSAAGALVAFALLFVLPAPFAAVVEGVVWVPVGDVVRTEAEGAVAEILPSPTARSRPVSRCFGSKIRRPKPRRT
jgi:putative peptide zinc metalloprotease protein